MRFEVLGPLRVSRDASGPPVSGLMRRRLTALLLANANQTVSGDWLAEALWTDETRATGKLHLLVHRLRKLLDAPERLVFEGGGYRLQVEPDELDASRFDTLLDCAAATDDPQSRAGLLRQALDLWQGTPYQGLGMVELASEVERLTDRRLTAMEQLYAAELDLGHDALAASELADAVTAHPLRERLHALLMTALYSGGRQAEALAAYQRARRTLVAELGVEPGPELREAERRILAGEPPVPGRAAEGASVRRPAQLPHRVPGFVGRSGELAELDSLGATGEVPVVVVAGAAGAGKTALVTHWAHTARERFPDGQLYADLRGYAPDDAVRTTELLAGFLRALGLDAAVPDGLAERAARFRTVVDGRRILIVLDNAATAEQVRPLLPGTSSCLVLVTSRDALRGLAARDGAHRLVLDRLSHDDARALLAERLGRDAAAPGTADLLIERCARLPLALRVAADRIGESRGRGVAELAEELADEATRLDVLDTGDEETSMRAVFSWSYRRLEPEAARLFRLCAYTCGHPDHPIAPFPATALLGGGDVRTTRRLLDVLARAHLLIEHPGGFYTMHDLLRSYAAELAARHENREEATSRLLGYFLYTATAAMHLIAPGAPRRHFPSIPRPAATPPLPDAAAARRWLGAECRSLVCIAEFAAQTGRTDSLDHLLGILRRHSPALDDLTRLHALTHDHRVPGRRLGQT